MEQIKQTVLSAGKDAWNFLTGVTMSAAQSVSCAVSQTVGFAGEKLGELTKKYRQPLEMPVHLPARHLPKARRPSRKGSLAHPHFFDRRGPFLWQRKNSRRSQNACWS